MSEEKEKDEKISSEEKKTEIKKSNSKVLFGIIGALAVIIIVLLAVILKGGDKKEKDGESGNTEIAASTEEADEDTATTETADNNATSEESGNDNSDNDTPGNEDVVVTLSNQWESDGKFYGQIDVVVNNKSASVIKGWIVEIEVPDGVDVDSGWNCEYKVSGGKLIISGVDYNAEIAANSSVKDIGLILTAKSKADLESVTKNASLSGDSVVEKPDNDEKTDATTEQEDNSVTENTTEATTEQKTEGTTEEKEEAPSNTESGTPFANHGKLSVKGTDLVDASGKKYQLKGVSTHGIAWFPDYVNKDAIKTIRDDWNANLFRIAMYSGENSGYCTGGNKENLKSLVTKGVDAATELGMYVIIDWHVLGDQNPLTYKEEAKEFFAEMSKKYKNNGNVIYEICNEPNGGTSWSDVKKYAEEVIPIIKKNSPDAVIIVGTPTWSQDVDKAANDPVSGYSNIMYAVHFYAATHTDWLRDRVKSVINSGIPVFISEFSICDASGNGAIDYNQAESWYDLMKEYNLSYASWSLCNKAETSALISSSCSKTSGWSESDLSDTGKWLRKKMRGK